MVIFHSYVRHVSLPEGTYCVRLAAAFFGVGDSHRIVFPPQDDKPPRIRWVVFPDFSGYVPTIFDEDDPYIFHIFLSTQVSIQTLAAFLTSRSPISPLKIPMNWLVCVSGDSERGAIWVVVPGHVFLVLPCGRGGCRISRKHEEYNSGDLPTKHGLIKHDWGSLGNINICDQPDIWTDMRWCLFCQWEIAQLIVVKYWTNDDRLNMITIWLWLTSPWKIPKINGGF